METEIKVKKGWLPAIFYIVKLFLGYWVLILGLCFSTTSANFWNALHLIQPVFFEEWNASENDATGFPSEL